ncbi:MAG: 16S rRNA processing protein RimM [Desulfovibrionaceae bacterium]|nr:16S rRNA processing protein RimM [Desulfovibrionaceae bacterium]
MLITAGKIVRPHGIKGEVSVESYLDSPSLFCGEVYLQAGEQQPVEYTVTAQHSHQDRILLTFRDVNDRNMAEELRGQMLLIPRSRLAPPEPGEVYLHDIIGLEVFEAVNFEYIGIVADINVDTGQEVWFIETPAGKEILFPAVSEFVELIDLEKGQVTIRPPEGLLEIYL